MSMTRKVKVSKMKHGGFFSKEEMDQIRLETAQKAMQPVRDKSPFIVAGLSGMVAIAAYKSDVGLLATIVLAGAVGALAYFGLPKAFDALEAKMADHVDVEEYRITP